MFAVCRTTFLNIPSLQKIRSIFKAKQIGHDFANWVNNQHELLTSEQHFPPQNTLVILIMLHRQNELILTRSPKCNRFTLVWVKSQMERTEISPRALFRHREGDVSGISLASRLSAFVFTGACWKLWANFGKFSLKTRTEVEWLRGK